MSLSTPASVALANPSRILVREVNWLGDLVISLPALRAVRRRFPNAHLAVLVRAELAGFFDGCDWIDEIIGFRRGSRMLGFADRLRIVGELRARRFDLAVLFPNSFSSALWTTLARVPRRAGYATDARGPMLTDKAQADGAARNGHQVNYWLAMVKQTIGAEGSPEDCAIAPAPGNRQRMAAMLAARRKHPAARLIAVAPAVAYGPAKEWPAGNYAALIDLLAEGGGAECILVGASSERERCERIAAQARAGAIVVAGETGVGELIAMLSLCDGFVGNDSGAMHLAGALGLPTVAIFGSTDPLRTGPLGPRVRVIWRPPACSPCLERTCRYRHYECLRRVAPGEVREAILAALAA